MPLKFLTHYDYYNPETKTYTHSREAGLYAMLNWSLKMVCMLELNGYEVNDIHMYLNEYIRDHNSFSELFEIKDIKLSLNSLSDDEKISFFKTSEFTNTGFGEDPRKLNLGIINQVISKFFNPNNEVLKWYDNFIEHLNCSPNDIVFVWARQTDKVHESKLPTIDEYIKVISSIDLTGKKILIQTDDHSVLQEFKDKGLEFLTLPQISLPKKDNAPFHINIFKMTDEEFIGKYKITKIDHLRQMVALAVLSKNAYKTILYPGNPTTFIPLFNGSFEDCLLFKDNLNLF